MNFKEMLSKYNIPIGPMNHYHCRENWVNIDCPYCSRDTQGWYMGINLHYNYISCWRCGAHPLINTLMEITGEPYHKIKGLLDDLDISYVKKEKPKGKLVLPKGIGELQSTHKKYLQSRGFNWQELVNLWHIQGIGVASKLSWRIFIPIIHHSQVVSWTTRSVSGNEYITRYVSAGLDEESIPHKELLYGEDFTRHAIIVVEGIFDAWKIGPGAVATFGSGYSQKQLERIAKYPIRAICFDSEYAAQKKACNLCNDLSVFPDETFNIVLDSKDPGEATTKEIKRLRKEILE